MPAETVSTAATNKTLGCSLAGDASPFPAGSLTGKIALIERGICNFSEKVFNAQRGGAIAAFVYNNAGQRRRDRDHGRRRPRRRRHDPVVVPAPHATGSTWSRSRPRTRARRRRSSTTRRTCRRNPGDVMAGFSSRGPTQDKSLKPDVVAPGVDVRLVRVRASATSRIPFTGFGSASGTSMATPHVAGSAALLLAAPPELDAGAGQVGADDDRDRERLDDSNQDVRAGVLDRGAGRIDLTKAGTPGLTLDHPSLSAGELVAGQGKDFTIKATDVSGAASTWTVSRQDRRRRRTSTSRRARARSRSAPTARASFSVHLGAAAAAAPRLVRGQGRADERRHRTRAARARVAPRARHDADGRRPARRRRRLVRRPGLPGLLGGLQEHVRRAGRHVRLPRRVERRLPVAAPRSTTTRLS